MLSEKLTAALKYVQTEIFCSPEGNYPAEYFVKYIIRQHGIEKFNLLKVSYDWIALKHFKEHRVSGDWYTLYLTAYNYLGFNGSYAI